MRIPDAGEPGHGLGAVLRRQPVRDVLGRAVGGYTALFELICPDCGDDPGLGYWAVPSRLQRLRGPRTMAPALAAYERHLGLGLTAYADEKRAAPLIRAEGSRNPPARPYPDEAE